MNASTAATTGRDVEPDDILTVRGLRRSFGGIQAVRDVDFTVRRGTITGLIGPNGSGKSTTFNLVSGFLRPDAGVIEFDGRDVAGLRPSRLAGLGMGRTFQLTEVFTRLSVLDNVLLALRADRNGKGSDEREIAMSTLAMVGLEDFAHARALALSYGQQKLLDLATVLATRPKLLLLDEPVAGITGATINRLRYVLERLRDEFDTTILLIEHNLPLAMELCDWIHVLDRGSVLVSGKPLDVRHDPKVIAAYLGGTVIGELEGA
jgi:ABC-type branched-subunit amino acid transport system ATPase component